MQKNPHPMSIPNASLVVCKGKKGKVKAEKNKKGYLKKQAGKRAALFSQLGEHLHLHQSTRLSPT
jgi:hypothetical protein